MTHTQAKELVIKLASTYANSKFDSIKRQSYVEALEELDHATVTLAIKKLIKTNRFCPAIAEINDLYIAIKKNEIRYLPTSKKSDTTCNVCEGYGRIVKDRTVNNMPYPYVFHCLCPAGKPWAYDGSKISENRSDFYVAPINDYYSIQPALSLASSC